jgi:hypothetical protein
MYFDQKCCIIEIQVNNKMFTISKIQVFPVCGVVSMGEFQRRCVPSECEEYILPSGTLLHPRRCACSEALPWQLQIVHRSFWFAFSDMSAFLYTILVNTACHLTRGGKFGHSLLSCLTDLNRMQTGNVKCDHMMKDKFVSLVLLHVVEANVSFLIFFFFFAYLKIWFLDPACWALLHNDITGESVDMKHCLHRICAWPGFHKQYLLFFGFVQGSATFSGWDLLKMNAGTSAYPQQNRLWHK